MSQPRSAPWAAFLLRVALATAFLSAVADRFGLWGPPGSPGVAWGAFGPFLDYTASLLPFVPEGWIGAVGWIVTAAEVALALLLLAGYRVREAAAASALLLLGFGAGMVLGDGVKAPFDASVFTAAAGAFLLSSCPDSPWSVDRRRSGSRPAA